MFVLEGTLFGAASMRLLSHQRGLDQIFGVVIVVLGVAFLGYLPLFSREVRIHRLPRIGVAGAPLLGVVFGIGWAPCTGPTLGAVLVAERAPAALDRPAARSSSSSTASAWASRSSPSLSGCSAR